VNPNEIMPFVRMSMPYSSVHQLYVQEQRERYKKKHFKAFYLFKKLEVLYENTTHKIH